MSGVSPLAGASQSNTRANRPALPLGGFHHQVLRRVSQFVGEQLTRRPSSPKAASAPIDGYRRNQWH